MLCITFTAFNRVDYFVETMNSWAAVNNLDKVKMIFNIEKTDKLKEMIAVLDSFRHNSSVGDVTINVNEGVIGCAKNSWNALERGFEHSDSVVLAEEDFIVSNDIIDMFTAADKLFKDQKDVMVVSGRNETVQEDNPYAFRKLGLLTCWVWMTWKDRWNTYLRNTWDFDYSSGKATGTPGGWDWNIRRIIERNNMFNVVPGHSRSNHIGINGIHSNAKSFTTNATFKPVFELKEFTYEA